MNSNAAASDEQGDVSQLPSCQIGPYQLSPALVLAPMAGVTDLPFRQLCQSLGCPMVVSEMLIADPSMWRSRKSQYRLKIQGEPAPRAVQIAGSDPIKMAESAKILADLGADMIDINMGCPVKKVLKKAAGSALLQDEQLVEKILTATVDAVDIPVTLKTRTGWDKDNKFNGVQIAQIAQDCGVQSLAIHGRTRACRFVGEVDYQAIASIKAAVDIPVFANGDIQTPEQAKRVLEITQADGLMIGRAAQGNPWIFREIASFLETGCHIGQPDLKEVRQVLCDHLQALYSFYGEKMGPKIARKHVGWYLQKQAATHQQAASFQKEFNRLDNAKQQLQALQVFLSEATTALREEIAA